MTNAGEVQRAIIGHSTTRMHEHYSYVALDDRRTALERATTSLPRPRNGSGERAGDLVLAQEKTR